MSDVCGRMKVLFDASDVCRKPNKIRMTDEEAAGQAETKCSEREAFMPSMYPPFEAG